MTQHPVGSEIEGEVKNITEFGLFVSLAGDIDGMVHLSDLDWERSGEEAIQDYKKGDMVRAKVLDIDTEKERISLGVKQLSEDPFESGAATIRKGAIVTCTVTQLTDNGIEVTVGDGMPGFIRKAELSRDRSEQRSDRFAVGEKVDAKVTQIDQKSRRLTLSIKAREAEEEKKAMQDYGSSDSGSKPGRYPGRGAPSARGRSKIRRLAEDYSKTFSGRSSTLGSGHVFGAALPVTDQRHLRRPFRRIVILDGVTNPGILRSGRSATAHGLVDRSAG